jgi:hypothetical protein
VSTDYTECDFGQISGEIMDIGRMMFIDTLKKVIFQKRNKTKCLKNIKSLEHNKFKVALIAGII